MDASRSTQPSEAETERQRKKKEGSTQPKLRSQDQHFTIKSVSVPADVYFGGEECRIDHSRSVDSKSSSRKETLSKEEPSPLVFHLKNFSAVKHKLDERCLEVEILGPDGRPLGIERYQITRSDDSVTDSPNLEVSLVVKMESMSPATVGASRIFGGLSEVPITVRLAVPKPVNAIMVRTMSGSGKGERKLLYSPSHFGSYFGRGVLAESLAAAPFNAPSSSGSKFVAPVEKRERNPYNKIESTETDYWKGHFGSTSRVSGLRSIFTASRLYHGELRHEILGELNVTLKLLKTSKQRKVAKYFMSHLRHPNILERFETGFLKYRGRKLIYIAMENCHQYNLQQYLESQIENGVSFDSDKYLSYSHQLALVVEFLHRHEVIIGNLSLYVILLSVDETTIKICDFGPIAKDPDDSSTSRDIFLLGKIFHSLWYYHPDEIFEKPILVPNPTLAVSLLNLMLSEESSSRPSAEEVLRHEIFRPIGNVLSEDDESSGVEEVSNIAEEVEKLQVVHGDVVTKIKKGINGIAITKSLSTVIPMEEHQVLVGGCYVTFPPESFDEPSPVKLVAEIDSSKWPRNFTGYTPTLYVTAKGLRKKLHLKLPSWRVCSEPQKAQAYVLHCWKYTDTTLPVTSEPYFEFDWGDFCPIVVGNSTKSSESTCLRMSGAVFVSDDAEVSVVYHINDQSSSSAESMVIQAISANMAELVPPKHLKIRLKPFIVREDEEIETRITCEDPDDLQFKPSDPFTFTIKEEFGEKLEHHGAVLGNLHDEPRRIALQCVVRRKGGNQIGNPSIFTCYWIPRQDKHLDRKVMKRKKPSKSKKGGFNLLLDQRTIAAHNVADRGAQLSNVQSGSQVQIGVQSALHGENFGDASDVS